jgi:hypothetical protein
MWKNASTDRFEWAKTDKKRYDRISADNKRNSLIVKQSAMALCALPFAFVPPRFTEAHVISKRWCAIQSGGNWRSVWRAIV